LTTLPAPDTILRLIDRFDRNKEEYKNPSYNETQLRREFLDPFFGALGWDVENKQGYAEAYKDVVHQDAIKVGSATKAPDYSFRIGGMRKFFVEAKKPAINLKEDIAPAYQLRRYAWSAKLPLSILTDFEEFVVYDCRIKPVHTDKSSTARTLYLPYIDYEKQWDEIYNIFSHEAVLKGSFDKYAETNRLKKGTAEVDDAFLKEIESWRDTLARTIALRNTKLTQRELNFAVQRTIDRVIFLRICEDRGVETYGTLMALQNGDRVYKKLCEIFYRADEKYNSGLFHFQQEKGRPETPDELTLTLDIDDKPLKEIIKGLYYPDSPYEFSVLPADILGQVYEQFLGKVIRLTEGHRAVVEDKPEVKKAGGVYYTPTYIVEYIVKNTVGKLLEGKTPNQVAKLRILDPACGSGSFLIAAYQHLLDWHRDWYIKDGIEKWTQGRKSTLYQGQGGDWRLTTSERKRILLNNIYGVDIDDQAVEVTKLSLLLKVLEGENEQTLSSQLKLFHVRALPDLGDNIKCGNSLIGPDFYDGQQLSLIDEEERIRINPFNWNEEFAEIMKDGGFDAVIGNPPYGAAFMEVEKEYLNTKYPSMVGQPESYEYFIFVALQILRDKSFLSFITPSNFIESDRAENLRRTILSNGSLYLISSFRYRVWKDNAAETLVFAFKKKGHDKAILIIHPNNPEEFIEYSNAIMMNQRDWEAIPKCRFLIRANTKILKKIEISKIRLAEVCSVGQGIIVYKTKRESLQNPYIAEKVRGPEWKKLLDTSSTIYRYGLNWGKKYLKYGKWLWRPRDSVFFDSPKILFVRLRNKSLERKLVGTYDDEKFYNRDNFNNIIAKDKRYSIKYILGIFNSTLINYWYKSYFDNVNINPEQVNLIPIQPIEFINPSDKKGHDEIVTLVDRILELHKQLKKVKFDSEKVPIQRQIAATDRKIDELVYELYGLTEEEVRIVEEQGKIKK